MPTMRTIGDLIAVLQGIDANIEIKNALQNQDVSILIGKVGKVAH